jgi:hypothetical protein
MKYLKTYESLSYTDIRNDIEDILSEIVDMGYSVRVLLTDFFHIVEINIYNISHPEAFTQDNLEEINETIGRLYDYMRGHKEYGNVPNSVYLSSYDLPPYNTPGKRRLVGWASIDGRYSDFAWVNLSANFNKIEISYRK